VLAITPRLVRGVTVPIKSLTSFTTGKEDEPSLKRPMASFDLEPDFEGEAETKDLPGKQHAKPAKPTIPTRPTRPTRPTKPILPPAAGSPRDAGEAQHAATPSLADTPVPASIIPAAPVVVKPGLLQIGAPANINVGQQFYVDIKVADVQNLNSSQLVLTYDPKLVDHVSTTEGPFLKKDGKPTVFSSTANTAEGTVTIKLSRAPNSGGYSGTGSLVSALFRAKGKGPASFNFQSVNFSTADGKPLEMLPFSTAVNVR